MHVRVDIVVFRFRDSALQVLLKKRTKPPFVGRMELPGRRLRPGESLHQAAVRQLRSRTGMGKAYLEQLYSFDGLPRDSGDYVITVTFYALVPGGRALQAGREAHEGEWRNVDLLPPLAFEHRHIIAYARERLRAKLEYTTVGFQLLPKKFTLSELQAMYETILGKKLDKRNFRKKIDLLRILRPLREWRQTGRKPARLYVFLPRKFERLKDKGILFPF